MSLRKVHDMNVVPDAGAVPSRIVGTEHIQMGPLTQSHLLNIGHQVVRNAHRVLPNPAYAHTANAVSIRRNFECSADQDISHIIIEGAHVPCASMHFQGIQRISVCE